MSHDFNHDPEVRELREHCGDWMGYAWQELLSIADRNDGIVKGSDDSISSTMGRTSLGRRLDIASKQARSAFDWMLKHNWIERCFDAGSPAIRIVNHAKYHPTRDVKEIPEGNSKGPLLPNLPTNPNKNKNTESDRPIPDLISPKEKKTRVRSAATISASPQPAIVRVVARINELSGASYRPDSKIVRTGLLQRMAAGATESDCLLVVEDRWCEWRDKTEMRQHFNPETLFRESNFEKYLNAARIAERNSTNGHKSIKQLGNGMIEFDGRQMKQEDYDRRFASGQRS